MKKLLLSALAALTLVGSANALDFQSKSFTMPFISSLMVSNKTLGVSNLLNNVSVTGITGYSPTNAIGVVYSNFLTGPLFALTTNNVGTGVFVTNGTVDTTVLNLFQDVEVFPPGAYPGGAGYSMVYYSGTNGPGQAALATYQPSGMNILIKLVGTNAAANSAVTFVFDPLYDGTNVSTATTADPFVVGVTANGTTPVCIATNVPMYRWPGVRRIRLSAIADGDTDASSNVFIQKCSLNYWVP